MFLIVCPEILVPRALSLLPLATTLCPITPPGDGCMPGQGAGEVPAQGRNTDAGQEGGVQGACSSSFHSLLPYKQRSPSFSRGYKGDPGDLSADRCNWFVQSCLRDGILSVPALSTSAHPPRPGSPGGCE